QLALAWVLSHPVVTTALVGARTEREIADGAGATAIHLTPDDLRKIDAVMRDAAGMTDELPT
ncbi:MAG: aldo/keto reductase, partial [Thermomicrobiales bacterium]